ncbi:MAG: hypothetical protein J5I59_05100 [Saprospiraceae bacterium]|nr:hypothetical protein [Saprospiraceae bacterium]
MQELKTIENVLKAYDYSNGNLVNFLIGNDSLKGEESSSSDKIKHIAFRNLIDFGTKISEPGFEHRETLEQTCEAACLGGFAAIMTFPNSEPVVDNQSGIEYLTNRSGKYKNIKILPLGAVSQHCQGEDLAGLLEMNDAGAIAFSDGHLPIQNGGLLMRAMDYVKGIRKVICDAPYDNNLFPVGMVDEGIVSTTMGVPGIPAPAEEIVVNRDIQLARYTSAKLHLSGISTPGSIRLIREAKEQGIQVTASVSVNNLIFSSEEVMDFDSNLKLMPPLRDTAVSMMLWEAVKDGTIDIISSQHMAYEVEKKDLEFQFASFGALGLQTSVAALLTKFGQDAVPVIQRAMSDRIIDIFQLDRYFEVPVISVFENTGPIMFKEEHIQSNCKNSPFIGRNIDYHCNYILK